MDEGGEIAVSYQLSAISPEPLSGQLVTLVLFWLTADS